MNCQHPLPGHWLVSTLPPGHWLVSTLPPGHWWLVVSGHCWSAQVRGNKGARRSYIYVTTFIPHILNDVYFTQALFQGIKCTKKVFKFCQITKKKMHKCWQICPNLVKLAKICQIQSNLAKLLLKMCVNFAKFFKIWQNTVHLE